MGPWAPPRIAALSSAPCPPPCAVAPALPNTKHMLAMWRWSRLWPLPPPPPFVVVVSSARFPPLPPWFFSPSLKLPGAAASSSPLPAFPLCRRRGSSPLPSPPPSLPPAFFLCHRRSFFLPLPLSFLLLVFFLCRRRSSPPPLPPPPLLLSPPPPFAAAAPSARCAGGALNAQGYIPVGDVPTATSHPPS